MSEEAARQLSEDGSISVSLRIRHPSIDPNEITSALSLAPEHAWACGEPRRSEAGLPLGGKRHDSYWMATLPGVSAAQWEPTETDPRVDQTLLARTGGDLPSSMSQVQMQLQIMAQIRRHRAFLERLIKEDGEVTFVIEIEASPGVSFRLDPALMRQLGVLGLRLELEFI